MVRIKAIAKEELDAENYTRLLSLVIEAEIILNKVAMEALSLYSSDDPIPVTIQASYSLLSSTRRWIRNRLVS